MGEASGMSSGMSGMVICGAQLNVKTRSLRQLV